MKSHSRSDFRTACRLIASMVMVLVTCDLLAQESANFDRDIAPILIDHCLDCHSGTEPNGDLDLAHARAALGGGQSGVAITAGKPEASLLWQRVDADEMPPKNPLGDQEKQMLRKWISQGALWGTDPINSFAVTTTKRAGNDWWALQSIVRPEVPKHDRKQSVRNPVDAFVIQKLHEKALFPSPEATPRVLIRRLYFDLLGLPPSPEEVSRFEGAMAEDHDVALDELVQRLLASRHFGERWGRHWLDVVRFGESQGFERDKLRSDSWYYRDWVMDAFNNDMPYDDFVRRQIAGDILAPDDPGSIIATGFLVAGPWDEVGQSQRSAGMKAVVRQDELEDYVGTIGQSFLGLTVNCARCHDHKFDPIRQKEYYQLASAVSGVRHGSRDVISQDGKTRIAEIDEQIRWAQDEISQLDGEVRRRLQKASDESPIELPNRVLPVSRWDFEQDTNDQIGEAHATEHKEATIVDGRLVLDGASGRGQTRLQNFSLQEKTLEVWVRLADLDQRGGAAISVHDSSGPFDAIVYGERQPNKWMAGSEFFHRTQDVDGPKESDASQQFVHLAISYHSDGTIACYRNGRPYGARYQSSGPRRYPSGQWYVMFGLRNGGPADERQLRGALELAQLYDRALSDEQILDSFQCEESAITHRSMIAAMNDSERMRRDAIVLSIGKLEAERASLAPYSVYAVKPGQAEIANVLHRGNPATPGEMVTPGGVAAISAISSDFNLAADAPDHARRRRLAQWITDPQNPLFARVIVNRLWHYHFGAGLVETPNDFGFNGGRPSHPELLDWLSSELIDSGWSLKHVHRLIVNSATYLQTSRHRADCAKVDASNRLLWRKSPMRLEAEALRDAMLSVAGQLNHQYGGAPYRDFATFENNTQFYTMTDPDSPDVYRRTVYRTWIRSGRNQLLDAFDCPDPSTTAPKRAITTTPIQSLALMNNSFVLRMSDRFAERVIDEVGRDESAQATRVFQLAFGRPPSRSEGDQIGPFVRQHGLSALCRVVFNSNEFIHVD